MRVSVDGVGVEVEEGSRLLDAVRAAGVDLPSLCADPRLEPYGSCRTCMVAVDGVVEPVPACTTLATDGAEVSTGDAVAYATARTSLELIVRQLPSAPAGGTELAHACELLGVREGGGGRGPGAVDTSHPYIAYDPQLCIACARCVRICDEVQGTFALAMTGRGADTVMTPGTGGPWAESDCVSCGACADTCPSGAIATIARAAAGTAERVTTTTCGYCGVGCTLDVRTAGDEVVEVRPNRDAPVNRGHACVKGRFAHGFVRSPDRLRRPLIRRGGDLVETSWEEALGHVGGELQRIVAEHGPDAVAAISSARATNEENYLMQKLMRVAVGTNNVDNCARICHAPSAAGLVASFGLSGGTNPFEDFDRADVFLLCGSNPTEAHPVVGARIKQRVIAGAKLVVVDPRRIELAGYADVHLRPRPGTNVAVFNGLAAELIRTGRIDEAFVAGRTEGFEELRELVASYTPEAVEEISGVPAADLARAAALYGDGEARAIVWGLGITEHAHGTEGVRTLCNLAALTGSVGTPDGCGANPLRGQNNVQGASDMGAMPDVLPGYQKVADPEIGARFEATWGVPIRPERGLRIPEMFDAAVAGELKALIVFGEDIVQTDPDSTHVRAAIDACELVVSHEIFLSETAAMADVVLPAASFLEKDGTFTNFDRRVQRVRPALPPPGEATPDFDIINAVATALGTDLGCPTPADAYDEMASLTPTFAGISHGRLDREGPIAWPCRSADAPGERRLYEDGFATASGRAQLASIPYRPSGEEPNEEFPLLLVTGRRLEHYNAGTMTRRTGNLELVPRELLELNPADALELGVRDGDPVSVASPRGEIEVTADVTDRVSPGQTFMAFHFPEAATNLLTSQHADEATTCPEYKVTAVRVRSRR
ncbi:MAG: formate dehydrogenase subunit alpha [Solirubrobacterales bacterium]